MHIILRLKPYSHYAVSKETGLQSFYEQHSENRRSVKRLTPSLFYHMDDSVNENLSLSIQMKATKRTFL